MPYFLVISILKILEKAILWQTAGLPSQVPAPVHLRDELPDWR